MVHHYFNRCGHGEADCRIHFDNCSGQNKNNMVWSMERYHRYIYNNAIPVLGTLNFIISFFGEKIIKL
jgi:predicted GNAT superfamily acetyltransferase